MSYNRLSARGKYSSAWNGQALNVLFSIMGEGKMSNSSQIHVFNLQISIFTPELRFNKNAILAQMIGKFAEIFDGDPISLPIPDNSPDEIPRIILNSKDETHRCEIAKDRLNLYCGPKDDLFIDKEIGGFLDSSSKIIGDYMQFTSSTVGRLAVVILKYIEQSIPSNAIPRHFCKEKWLESAFSKLAAFEIHALKKVDLDDFHVNCWVRCKSGKIESKTKDKSLDIIHITQDINTLSEELKVKDYSIKDIKRFFSLVSASHISMVREYFPEK